MAAPITHVIFAEKVFQKFFSDKTKKDFFIGTLFPDIRYLGVIAREKTHFYDFSLHDLQKEDSFLAGVKFHAFLDSIREKYIVEKGFYSLVADSKYITQSIKILEDKIYYSSMANWQEHVHYLDDVLPGEVNFGIDPKDIQRWHSLLQEYLLRQPDVQSMEVFSRGINISEGAIKEMKNNIIQLEANEKVMEIIHGFYRDFDSLVI